MKLRLGLILAFMLFFVTYQYSGLRNYLKADNITYRVQITAAFQNPVPINLLSEKFSIEDNIREDYHQGWFKYSVGSFPDYYDARDYRDKLIAHNKTYGAFVVLIKDDIRMDAMDTTPNKEVPTLQLNNKVHYKIQIKASAEQININDLKTQLGIAEDVTEEYSDNLYKYTIGNCESYDDIKNLYYRVVNIDKVSDAFIVTYYGNKRISVFNSENKIRQTRKVIHNEIKPKTKTEVSYKIQRQAPQIKPAEKIQKVRVKEQAKQEIIEPPKQEPVVEQTNQNIEQHNPDIILFHINADKLKSIKKKPIQLTDNKEDITETPEKANEVREIKNDNYSNPEKPINNPIIIKNTDTNTYKQKYIKKSFINRLIDEAKSGSKRSYFIWTLLILIFYFILNLVVVITIVFVSRIRKINKEKKIKKIEEDFQLLLAEFLFDPGSEKEALNKLRNTSSTFKRNILLDELMKLCVDLSGEVLEKLKVLYFNMELDKDSLKKLDNRRWFIKVKGCRELTRMKAYNAKAEIEKLLNSKNEILRAEAQMALIELSEDNPYYFLEKLTHQFLPWEQLNVHVMMQRNAYEIPDFSKWLNLENETVVLFAIEMIRVYRQIMNAPKIIKFFKHPNKNLREAAIIAAGELGYVEVVPEMIKIYNEVEDEFKVLILRSMQKLADDSNKDFLKGVIESNAPQYIKLDAAKAMFALGIKGQIELKRYSQTDDIELNAIIKHVFDERI